MVKQKIFQTFYKLHIYVGAFIAVHISILSITGLGLLFKEDIQSDAQVSHLETYKNREHFSEKYNQAAINLHANYPNDRILDMYPDERNINIIKGRLGIDNITKLRGAKRVALDFNSGKEIVSQQVASDSKFFNWMLILHREIFLGAKGQTYIGFVGLVYVFLLISGFLIYGRFMKRKAFGEIRSARNFKFSDLHKFVGMVSFGWSLVIGITGFLLAFNPIFMKNFREKNLSYLTQQYQVSKNTKKSAAPLSKILNTALNTRKDSLISYIIFPEMERGIPGHYLIMMNGTTPITQQIREYLVINSTTAKFVESIQLPLSMQMALVSRPLHFGNYGGMFLKIIWVLFTLCSLGVAVFGIFSFFVKKRKNRATKQESPITNETKQQNSISLRHPYTQPFFLMVLSLIGIIIALFIHNYIVQMSAICLLLIPIFAILFGRRRNG